MALSDLRDRAARARRELPMPRRWSPRPAGTRSRPTGASFSISAPSMRCAPMARVIATAATLPYGGRCAWISMVLVAARASPARSCDAPAAIAASPTSRRPAWCRCSTRRRPDARSTRRSDFRTPGASRGCARDAQQSRGAASRTAVAVQPITDAVWPALCAYDADGLRRGPQRSPRAHARPPAAGRSVRRSATGASSGCCSAATAAPPRISVR